jgi:two-component system, LuxR family, response regulator FixJ
MTVALIDDDAAVLDSLKMLLSQRGVGVECFASAEAFLSRLSSLSVSCVVSDVRMPGLSGLDLQAELARLGSAIPLVLITGHGDIAMAVGAVKRGAFDFIEKPFNPQELADTIRRAAASTQQQREQQVEAAAARKHAGELSQRQREVMNLVVQGLSNKEIALRLRISPRTVENYRAWVMEKMEAPNLAALVRMVVLLEARGEMPPAPPARPNEAS